jgi:hypothetical protein
MVAKHSPYGADVKRHYDCACPCRQRQRLPNWTEADLYLALTRRWLELAAEGHEGSPEGAGASLMHETEEPHARSASMMVRRWVR